MYFPPPAAIWLANPFFPMTTSLGWYPVICLTQESYTTVMQKHRINDYNTNWWAQMPEILTDYTCVPTSDCSLWEMCIQHLMKNQIIWIIWLFFFPNYLQTICFLCVTISSCTGHHHQRAYQVVGKQGKEFLPVSYLCQLTLVSVAMATVVLL